MGSAQPLDPETADYFDSSVPEYSVHRLDDVARFISGQGNEGASLIDVGAGTGNTLAFLKEATGISDLAAIDVSGECLRALREQVESETHLGSILDADFVGSIDKQFDFAILAAVLHHLIGSTREESRRYAELAVENSKRLLKPGGHLIIHEPVFAPAAAMTGVFYVKKTVTRLTKRRVPIFGYWNNIGSPVVSYYTSDQVHALAAAGRPSTIVHSQSENDAARLSNRLLRRSSVTLAARINS